MLHGTYAMNGDGVQVGSVTNRWYDKMQIIVCANGSAGVNFEHTSVDGHTVLRYCLQPKPNPTPPPPPNANPNQVLRFVSDLFASTIMRFAAKISNISGISGLSSRELERGAAGPRVRRASSFDEADELSANPAPHHIGWRLTPQLQQAVRFAEVRLSDLVHQNETCTLDFTGFGKAGIVEHQLSPDAFVQLAMMAAHYELTPTLTPTLTPSPDPNPDPNPNP